MMKVYDLIQCGDCFWEKNGVECTVGDWVIVESGAEGVEYMLRQVDALVATTEKHINKLTSGAEIKSVVANSTETIKYFLEKNSEDRGI